jgi:D-alanine-D-alanine ligase
LRERVAFIHKSVGTDAIAESYIEGRELYVGVLGNTRLQVLPPWELFMDGMPGEVRHIATERVKWSPKYQRKYNIASGEAKDLPEGVAERIRSLSKRIYRALNLSGYARIDLRLDSSGKIHVLEANPNPQIAQGEDFAESANKAGIPYPIVLQRVLNLGLSWRPDRLG